MFSASLKSILLAEMTRTRQHVEWNNLLLAELADSLDLIRSELVRSGCATTAGEVTLDAVLGAEVVVFLAAVEKLLSDAPVSAEPLAGRVEVLRRQANNLGAALKGMLLTTGGRSPRPSPEQRGAEDGQVAE